MAVTRIKNSGIKTGVLKYDSALGGYPPVMAAPTATAGASSASVAFTAVTGATSYTALSNPGSITGTGTSSPITVSGLTNGTAYTFQVRANNAVGSGAYSAASNSVTPIMPGKFESLASLSGNGSASVLTFNNIDTYSSDYKFLQIRARWEFTSGGGASTVQAVVYFNSDQTAGNYYTHWLKGDGTNVILDTNAGVGGVQINSAVPNNVSSPGMAIIDIAGYNDTSKRTTVRAASGVRFSSNTTEAAMGLHSGIWNSLSNVTSISVAMTAGRVWTSNTRLDLYGIRGV